MNDLIVILILVLLAALAVGSCLRRKNRNCGGGCSGCGGCGGNCRNCDSGCADEPQEGRKPQN